jgi:uncharacterized protein DUF4258
VNPPKLKNLLKTVRKCIEENRVRQSFHAKQRRKQRKINLPGMMHVLKTGTHEERKDKFDVKFKEWNYAIRGKTIDKIDARIIVSFKNNGMIIITAIVITRGN